jgi:hypothetical protein
MAVAAAAFVDGLRMVLRAPGLLVGIFAITTAVVAPIALWTARAAATDPAGPDSIATVGFNAVLHNLSAVFDGTRPSRPEMAAIVAYAAIWVPLWGAVLDRFSNAKSRGARQALRASFRWVVPMGQLTLTGLFVYATLFVGLHSLIFQQLYGWLEVMLATEQAAFAWRVVLYALFGFLLLMTSLIIDFARVRVVIANERSTARALGSSVRFIRDHAMAVTVLTVFVGSLYLIVLAVYAAFDLSSRGVSRASTALIVGQLFILGRVGIRLISAASQVRLAQLTESTLHNPR